MNDGALSAAALAAARRHIEEQRRRRRRFDLGLGLVMAVAGAVLLGPYLRLRLAGNVVTATILDLVPVPQDDGSMRLVTVFEYPLPGDQGLRRFAIGVGEIGIDGRRVAAPVVAAGQLREALDAFDRQYRDRDRVPERHALVLGEDGADTGLLTVSGAWRVRIGLILVLTPTVLAAIRLLVGAFTQLRQPGRRSLSTRPEEPRP